MKSRSGYTIAELLTTVSIMTVLMAVLVPVLTQTRRYARGLVSVRRQRDIVLAVTLFACEHQEDYPESVALTATGRRSWHWQDPRQIRTCSPRANMEHSSLAGYLAGYMEEPETMYCPSAPARYRYWRKAWQAGDDWDHPETDPTADPVLGTYCFFWNYIAYQEETGTAYIGPSTINGAPGESRILVSDYLGYDNWRAPQAIGSCEYLSGAQVAAGTCVSSAFWMRSGPALPERNDFKIRAYAGYIDGHVKRIDVDNVTTLRVAYDSRGTIPFPRTIESPGYFYVPGHAR